MDEVDLIATHGEAPSEPDTRPLEAKRRAIEAADLLVAPARGGLRLEAGSPGGSPRGGGPGDSRRAGSPRRAASPGPAPPRSGDLPTERSGARRGLGLQLGAGGAGTAEGARGARRGGEREAESPRAAGQHSAGAAAAVRAAISDAAQASASGGDGPGGTPETPPRATRATPEALTPGGHRAGAAASRSPLRAGGAGAQTAAGAKAQGGGEREERLAQMVEKLQARVKQLKAENGQLEELVQAAERKAGDAAVQALEQRVQKLQRAQAREAEAAQAALDKKDAEIIGLQAQLGAARSSAAAADERAQSLEVGSAQALQARVDSEAKVLAELRGELAASERALEEERGAHRATLQKAGGRERELESSLDETSAALASMQAGWDTLEGRASTLAAEVQRLGAEKEAHEAALAGTQAAAERSRGGAGEEAPPAALAEALAERDRLAEQLEEAAAAGRDLEAAAEKSRLRAKELFRDLEEEREKTRAAAAEDGKARELAELLYEKQTQLEDLAADRKAQQMAWERQLAEARSEVEQSHARRRVQTGGDIEDVVPMDSMGPVYNRLASNRRVGRYISRGARMVDASASTVSVLLLKHPLFRLVVFCYLVSLHGFVYLLLSRFQRSAISSASARP